MNDPEDWRGRILEKAENDWIEWNESERDCLLYKHALKLVTAAAYPPGAERSQPIYWLNLAKNETPVALKQTPVALKQTPVALKQTPVALKQTEKNQMDMRERATRAGKVVEEIDYIVGHFKSFRDCRNIQLGWTTADGCIVKGLHIGKPGIEWPNKELYEGLHDAVLEHLRRRRDALEAELAELMNGSSGESNTQG